MNPLRDYSDETLVRACQAEMQAGYFNELARRYRPRVVR